MPLALVLWSTVQFGPLLSSAPLLNAEMSGVPTRSLTTGWAGLTLSQSRVPVVPVMFWHRLPSISKPPQRFGSAGAFWGSVHGAASAGAAGTSTRPATAIASAATNVATPRRPARQLAEQ